MGAVLIEVILPVFFIFSVGFIGQKTLKFDIKSISALAIYIMMPALVFRTFYKLDFNSQYLYLVAFNLALFYGIVLILFIISKIRKYSPSVESGLILASGFMNSGNYGAPVILFAFGEEGFAYAISFFVLGTIFMNSFGVYYAARGGSSVKSALISVAKIPSIYAFLLAVLWKYTGVPMGENIYQVIDLVANATIPTVMLTLGMQLARIKITKIEWEKISVGLTLRLFISPLVAWVLTLFIPFDPLLKNVLIVIAAMPSAATTNMLALQFNTEPDLVSSITLFSTITSALTLSLLLTIL